MIGIGLEELGVEDFVQGKYFDGELYIDSKKQCYEALGFQRMGFFSMIGKLFAKVSRSRMSEARSLGGNMKGDAMQNGGTIVVEKGGKLLLKFVQENPAEHVELADVLKALNIPESSAPTPEGASAT